jgi:bacillopeptidase F (M6 metalloprotease family)
VHAGEDESAGGGAQGEDAIWAHRWYAYGTDYGSTGPDGNLLGGTQIGDTGICPPTAAPPGPRSTAPPAARPSRATAATSRP